MDKVFKVYKADIKNVDVKNAVVTAVVSTENPDRDDEVISMSAMEKGTTYYQEHPVLLACHEWRNLKNNIGTAKDFKFENGNTIVDFQYFVNKGNEEADWAFELAKEGLAAYSIGFIPKTWENAEGEKGRTCTELELLEISQVLIPANREALQVRSKSANVESELCNLAMLSAELLNYVDDSNTEEEEPKPDEEQIDKDIQSKVTEKNKEKESEVIDLKRTDLFRISGNTEIMNEHYHYFVLSKDKNGIVAGKTIDMFTENGDRYWSDENNDYHEHLIIDVEITAENNEHTHAILVFKDVQDNEMVETMEEVATSGEESSNDNEVVKEQEMEILSGDDILLEDSEIISMILSLNVGGGNENV